jgi:hypothetical protein
MAGLFATVSTMSRRPIARTSASVAGDRDDRRHRRLEAEPTGRGAVRRRRTSRGEPRSPVKGLALNLLPPVRCRRR